MTAVDTPRDQDGHGGVLGTRLRRREDPALLTGESRYVADLTVAGALHFALVRSSVAHARITSIDTADGPVDEAYPPMSVTIRLADELDVSRGDLICRPNNKPAVAQDIEAMVCWMDETRPMSVGGKYAIKHTTRSARAVVRDLHYRLDVNTLHRDDTAGGLSLNEIGRVRLRTTVPLLADDYRRNRTTGGFIVIDEQTNRTVGAGMIVDAS